MAFRTIPENVISQCGPAGLVPYPAVIAHTRKNSRSEAVGDGFSKGTRLSSPYKSLYHNCFALSERDGIRDVVILVGDLVFRRDRALII
ncbi:hypothetical protein [Desulfomonile tiedjei]|uniref:Uncharacterized protein n=1 Tax=Desulfomonile tiedjei (strain ATCC 49306 / DSM 6799 / DCB-1) TaxID=706587 RepID=I4C6R2_DESTA|nr:hypothetical protein [Desulfomonile tiedjei]AFM25253.1 hypothetical protein Desti_2573 [Desulfomonile tiedjei DSM 6799]